MKISILDGYHLPKSKTVKDNTFYSQTAYAYLGGAFPVAFEIPLETPAHAYPIGDDYTLCPSSFKVNQYENLELNRFKLKLVRVSKPQTK